MTLSIFRITAAISLAACLFAVPNISAFAGVTNPNISVLGEMTVEMSGAPDDPDRDRPRLALTGVEFFFEDYLNPFVRGSVVAAVHGEEFHLEEAYFEVVRGLPFGLGLKAGKARLDFGRLNQAHPHTYPFLETPAVSSAYSGEEGLNDVQIGISRLLPLPGGIAATISASLLQGDAFRGGQSHSHQEEEEEEEIEETRLGWNARWSNFLTFYDRHLLQIGLSAASGVNDPHEDTRTLFTAIDFKSKIYASQTDYLTIQGELLRVEREHYHADEELTETLKPQGFWLSADYTSKRRYYLGAKFESFQTVEDDLPSSSRIGAYGGFAVMEESTLVRLLAENVKPASGSDYNRYLLQAIFSMGPHKAHQF